MKRVCGGLLLTFIAIIALRGFGPAERLAVAQNNPANAAAGPWNKFEFRGNGSCGGTACHDARNPTRMKMSEFTIWIEKDTKHSLSLDRTIRSDLSKQIERNLHHPGKDWHDEKPDKDILCLKCHALKTDNPLRDQRVLDMGFSCENCHGPAEKWLDLHKLAGWSGKTPKEKEAFGMLDLTVGNLANRAQVCVDCHVGNAALGMEVNHDLIAAGHPRLRFEFRDEHRRYAKHWDFNTEKQTVPDLEARAWAVGQLVSAEVAADLLAYRADPKSQRPWPEFAEYECFGCHHDVRVNAKDPDGLSWRQRRGYAGHKPGDLPWGTWFFSPSSQTLFGPPLDGAVGQLRKNMGAAFPPRQQVADQARTLARQLQQRAGQVQQSEYTAPILEQTLKKMEQDFQRHDFAYWDDESQFCYRFGALYGALKDRNETVRKQNPYKDLLDRMYSDLEFPDGYKSPRDFQPKKAGQ